MASDKIEYSRLLIKRSNVSGEIPTVPPVSAVTLNQFTPTDIFVGEFFANVEDETLFFRTNTGIVEITVSGSTGTTIPSLLQVLNQGNTTGGFGIEVSSGDTITYNGLTSGATATYLGLDASGNTITTFGVGGENLENTLELGNTTGANDIIFTQGYRVEGALGKGYFEPEGSDESISVNYISTGNTGYLNIGDTTAFLNYNDGTSQSYLAIDGNKIQMTSNGGSFTTQQYGASSGLTINPEPGFPLYVTNLTTGTSVNSFAIDANDRVILAPAAINGTNGTSGTNGSSGTSGAAGTSGTNGTSGTSGVSGATGSSGTSGVSGTNGSSGTSGAAGASGTSGTSGVSGATGSSGTSGTNGTSGLSGVNGTSGTSGTNGSSGANGTSGTNGANGTSGTNGTSGLSGATGSSGTSGAAGTSGTSGAAGEPGASGTNGTSGTSGIGTNGTSGTNGAAGTSGTSGTGGGGGGGSTTFTGVTISQSGWTYNAPYYEYEYTNASITASVAVLFTPYNSSVITAVSANVYPYIELVYSDNKAIITADYQPTGDITGQFIIF